MCGSKGNLRCQSSLSTSCIQDFLLFMAIYARLDDPWASGDSPISSSHLTTGELGLQWHPSVQICVGSRDLNSDLHTWIASMLTHWAISSAFTWNIFYKTHYVFVQTLTDKNNRIVALIHQLPSRLDEGLSISQGWLWRCQCSLICLHGVESCSSQVWEAAGELLKWINMCFLLFEG